jgi:nitrate/nitrite transporter NarK
MQFLRELWGGLTDRLSAEPVFVQGVVVALISLVTSFGLGLTAEQVGAIVAFSAAILSLVARSKVTPTP